MTASSLSSDDLTGMRAMIMAQRHDCKQWLAEFKCTSGRFLDIMGVTRRELASRCVILGILDSRLRAVSGGNFRISEA